MTGQEMIYVDPWSDSTISNLLKKMDSDIKKYNVRCIRYHEVVFI